MKVIRNGFVVFGKHLKHVSLRDLKFPNGLVELSETIRPEDLSENDEYPLRPQLNRYGEIVWVKSSHHYYVMEPHRFLDLKKSIDDTMFVGVLKRRYTHLYPIVRGD
jgi:hypothetical protein